MARHISRRLPLLRWQYLRWGLVIPAIPLLWACNEHKLQTPTPLPQMETDFQVLVSPERAVDILFMIDNSPSMDPKQTALANNFPKMISVLESLPDGLPDVHIGVVSSNMGAGNGAMGGACGQGLGDMGLLWGNDPNNLVASVAAGGEYFTNVDPNHPTPPALIADGCGLKPGERWIEDLQNPDPNIPGRVQNYTNVKLEDVFSCLAKAVGVRGCGQEHQLQATRVSLIPQSFNQENLNFVRKDAYLAIVLITDEDDCSATNLDNQNDDMFNMATKRDPNDTTSLRCAARGHLCNNAAIPNFDHVAGYTGTGPYTHDFNDCSAKVMLDPKNPDYVYMPLIDVPDIIQNIKDIKGANWAQKILVSGIIGWPPGPNDTNLPSTVKTYDQYRIDKDPTSLPAGQQNLWDYMPICEDPNQTSADGNIYKGFGGLRLKMFIDAFGKNGQVFSICNSDFTNAMLQIGNAIVQVLKPGCVQYPLIDTKSATAVTEPECQVIDRQPCSPVGGTCLQTGFFENPLTECKDGNGNILDPASLDPNPPGQAARTQAAIDNVLSTISQDSRPCWYLSYDNDPAGGCPNAYRGQRISALRKTGVVAPPGTFLGMQCLTCASSDQKCCPQDEPQCDKSKL